MRKISCQAVRAVLRARGVVCIVFGVSAALLNAPSAHATLYEFSYSGVDQFDHNLPFSASGEFATTDTLIGGALTITSISGARDGVTISNLDPILYVGGNDNLFFPTGPFFDFQGMAYNANHLDYNLFFDASVGEYEESTSEAASAFTFGNVVHLSITPISTPEPGTLGLLGLGLAGVGFARRKAPRS